MAAPETLQARATSGKECEHCRLSTAVSARLKNQVDDVPLNYSLFIFYAKLKQKCESLKQASPLIIIFKTSITFPPIFVYLPA